MSLPVRLDGALPAQPTAIIGREAELAVLRDLLWRGDRRLVTLFGPGGVGKTTLAIVAAAAADNFTDGVAFVDLSALTDAATVPPSIVAALGLCGSLAQTGQEILHGALRECDLLLVLDNCEHLLGLAQSGQSGANCR
ncbi:MAG TPA: AAA family ATPase [Thermomicrobiales bacterium]